MKLQNLKEKIDADNEAFDNMTNEEKRVVIAQDCLDRIDIGQIKPRKSRFLCTVYGGHFNNSSIADNSVKDVINNNNDFECRACAKGSLFLSYVGRVNKVNFGDIRDDNEVYDADHQKLLEIFSLRQLALIEYFFEGRQYIHVDEDGKDIHFSREDDINVTALRNRLENDGRSILYYICNNIIKNEGTFILQP